MHACLSCGACCALYRVAFHWLEAAPEYGGRVPAALTEPLDGHRLVMKGTKHRPARCVALEADIGRHARCTIHADRPGVCREVAPSWEFGAVSPQCDRARLAHGMLALTPADWTRPVLPATAMTVHAGSNDDDPPPLPAAPAAA